MQENREQKGRTPEQSKPYPREASSVNDQIQKKQEFERKYDMSIHGNIYISPEISSCNNPYHRLLRLTPVTKGIYLNPKAMHKVTSSPLFWRVIRIVTV
jgi:hypothetical protein